MFGPGSLMGDMERAIAVNNLTELANGRIDEANTTARDQMKIAAENIGLRFATTRQLDRLDPENPLLQSDEVVDAIADAAYKAFLLAGKDYEASRIVGRTFKIPGREGPVPAAKAEPAAAVAPAAPVQPVSIDAHPKYMELEQAYAASLAMRAALSEVVRQSDANHPLLKNVMLVQAIRKAGVTAFVMGNKDYNAARDAGESFVLPGTPGARDTNRPKG